MANHTGKFVSVNLNKSYGRPNPHPSSSSSAAAVPSSRFGNGSRGRGGGGGGMVVLSRPRSGGQTRLAVPPPLNLPSLRKEHERQDPSAASGSLAAGGGGVGAAHGSVGVGWKKDSGLHLERPGDQRTVANPALLRGEDFPSLAAASHVPPHKLLPGQRQKRKEEILDGPARRGADGRSSPPPMRPQVRSSSRAAADEKVSNGENGAGSVATAMKSDGLMSPLPMLHLSHTSDWADDERDTSRGISDIGRKKGFSRNEAGKGYYSKELAGNDPGVGSAPARESYVVDSYQRDLAISGRDETSWRASQFSREGAIYRGPGVDRGIPGKYKSSALVRDNIRESRELGRSENGALDSRQPWRDSAYGHTVQAGRNGPDTCNLRNSQQNENAYGRHGESFNNRYKANEHQKDIGSKRSYSSGSKGFPMSDPILNFSRNKQFFSSSGKPYMEDACFSNNDPFSDDINLKVLRRKKDTPQVSFHDPVRDSFEAELERVQRMQEEERQRVIDEHTRALELARKEEEEREKIIREENERRKKLEDEAREAIWRAEQERLEASKKAEEEKIAWEEEKKRIFMEEERRKEAAHQKLLELEAKIAKRQAEAAAKDVDRADTHDVQASREVKRVDFPRAVADGDWEDSERVVERITSSASSNSSGLSRGFEMGYRPSSSKDGNLFFMEKTHHMNSWKKDSYDNGNCSFAENGYYNQQQDALGMGRLLPRRGIFGSNQAVGGRPSSKEGMSELHHTGGHGLSTSGDSDQYHRNFDFGNAFLDNENYSGVAGWGQARSRGAPHSSFSDNLFHGTNTDGFNSFGRSRHPMRQPRVLPPPSFSSVNKGSFRAAPERPSSSVYLRSEIRDNRNGDENMKGAYTSEYQEKSWQVGTVSAPQDNTIMEEHGNNTTQCDSHSSVSVSSSPTSPAHLSQDDVTESQHCQDLTESNKSKHNPLPEIETTETASDSTTLSLRDEDEWTVENNDEMHDLEEYAKGDNPEEDEIQEGDFENFSIVQHFDDSQLNMPDRKVANDIVVLGFNEGIEVKIPENDEIERSSGGEEKNDEKMVTGSVHDLNSYSALASECGTCSYSKNSSFPEVASKSPDNLDGAEKALQNLVIEPMTSTCASNSSEPFLSSELPPTYQVESALSPESSCQTGPTHFVSSSASAVPCQNSKTMELQFGLFTGPSLIPSPVPAIQIGSIQMPLNFHPSASQSIPHMQSSQPPFVQFGQLHYPSPISQGILPLSSQSMPLIQSSDSPQKSFNQNVGRTVHNHVISHSSMQNTQTKEKVVGGNRNAFDVPQGEFETLEPIFRNHCQQEDTLRPQNQAMRRYENNKKMEIQGVSNTTSISSSQSNSPHKICTGGKMYVYTVKNSGSRSQLSATTKTSRVDQSYLHRKTRRNIRRTEFRVRNNDGRRHVGLDLSNYSSQNDKPDFNRVPGGSVRNASKRGTYVNNAAKLALELQSTNVSSLSLQTVVPEMENTKEVTSKKVMHSFQSRDESLKSNCISEKDADASMQSGIVQIFQQPGIEIPSDEDDFIEVRSKRQMLNDKREQKEKEVKNKSRVIKPSRKFRSTSRSNLVSSNVNKAHTSIKSPLWSNSGSSPGGITGVNCATSSPCSADMVSRSFLPVESSPANEDSVDIAIQEKSTHTNSDPLISSNDSKLVPCLVSEDRGTSVNQQVMSLTQTQLDDAMKPAELDTHATLVSSKTSSIEDQEKLPSSAVSMDKHFPTSTTLSSLLSGEKIQFGAITTPAILPPVSRAIPLAIGPPCSASCISEFSIESNLSVEKDDSTIFFEKEKSLDESDAHLEDQDAEAEAAASAVAVAAICSDEVVGNSLAVGAVSLPENKTFDVLGVTASSSGSNVAEISCQSARDESLTVTLPADLSVETPSPSSWPPFSNPQSSNGPLLSHFPGAPSTHFPFFDVNSMLGGPVYAIGSHDDSAGTQSQSQKPTFLGSGSVGAWPQCPSSVESFYGSPTGFPGPFINPQGGIPGIQGPPHMLFYNPFAPQYSLSIMGPTTIVPPGKQPDWKHNPGVTGANESDTSKLNAVASQDNLPGIQSPIHHLRQVAPLVPMASHLPVFNMSSFQSSTDVPVQARWPHLPIAPLNSVPISMQLEQHHGDGGRTNQVASHCLPADSTVDGRFPESCNPTLVNVSRNFSIPVSSVELPSEFAQAESLSSRTACSPPKGALHGSSSDNNKKVSNNCCTGATSQNVNAMAPRNSISNEKNTSSGIKSQIVTANTASQQHLPPVGYADQRGCLSSSQKAGSGNDWHRKSGLQGRGPTLGADKSFPASKVKQVYVAKQPAPGTTATGKTKGT